MIWTFSNSRNDAVSTTKFTERVDLVCACVTCMWKIPSSELSQGMWWLRLAVWNPVLTTLLSHTEFSSPGPNYNLCTQCICSKCVLYLSIKANGSWNCNVALLLLVNNSNYVRKERKKIVTGHHSCQLHIYAYTYVRARTRVHTHTRIYVLTGTKRGVIL